MIALRIEFPAKLYHATPWGSHVNEGLVEWPPSPWRILRALLATGYGTLGWSAWLSEEGGEPPAVARALIEKLASAMPRYILPPTRGAHSRHYMPLAKISKGREDTTLVFDAWLRVEDALRVIWDVNLSAEESELLIELAARMNYLGRSESWVVMNVEDDDAAASALQQAADRLCFPATEDVSRTTSGWEQVALMTPLAANEYAAWLEQAEPAAVAYEKKPGKSNSKKAAPESAELRPADLTACLQTQTSTWQKRGWSQPPGSKKTFFWRRRDWMNLPVPRRRGVRRIPDVEAMLLALASPSNNNHALPSVKRTLPQADLLHKAIVRHASRFDHSPVLTGSDAERNPLQENHAHAHLLPLDLDGDYHLDHILIWAPMGLDALAQKAIRAVRSTYTKGGATELKVSVAAGGSLESLLRLPAPYADSLDRLMGRKSGKTEWISLTPFVPVRHMKKSGKDTLEGQIQAELVQHGHEEAAEVRIVHPREATGRFLPLRHFVRRRSNHRPPPQDAGFIVRLSFDRPVRGPICLGYGSHFGMGLFTRIDPADDII